MAFPASPTDGQTYSNNGTTYVYNLGLGVWDVQGASSAASGVTSVAGRTGAVTLTATDVSLANVTNESKATMFTNPTLTGTTTLSTVSAGAITATSLSLSGALTVGSLSGVSALNSVSVGATTASSGAFTTLSASGAVTFSNGSLSLTNATNNRISWNTAGVAAPTYNSYSAGTKLVLYDSVSASDAGYAIGIENSTMWFSSGSSGTGFKWYAGTNNHTSLTASGLTVNSSLGVGTAASGTTGEGRFTNSITAYYSDERLKTKINTIENALDKIDELTGFLYVENDLARSFGFNNSSVQTALSAQDVKRVQPEVVKPAPFDIAQRDDGTEYSRSGKDYLTVDYEKLIPLLVEGIKELRREINQLKGK